ncbi:hypothetical protein [Enterocloster bolteae]|uniref:hypothetical protein n=1 Tax=Enterocloster bolteae TaxID=208479 RepID=UPI002A834A9C|nr:hypothetical protein [Enterocloster bolteae]
MSLRLPIYRNGVIEKTYEVENFRIPYGVIQDVLHLVEVDKLNDEMAIAGMLLEAFDLVDPLLKDLFPGLTDDDLRHADFVDIGLVFTGVARYAIEKLSKGLKRGAN